MGVGAVAAALSVAYLPWHVDLLRAVERRLDVDGQLYAAAAKTMTVANGLFDTLLAALS